MDKPLFITTNEEYEIKLREVERLVSLDPEPESLDGIRLKYLANQIEIYEKQHFDHGAKLIKARKIRKEIEEECGDILLNFNVGLKKRITQIIIRNL